jgi:hypothetical protein
MRPPAAGPSTGTGGCTHRKISSLQKGGEPVPEQKIKRMNLHIEAPLHNAFKAATAAQGKNMTDVLLEFIQQYVAKYGLQPIKKGRR